MLIYCVEDDNSIRELVVYSLKSSGYEVIGFENGTIAQEVIKTTIPDLILLDIMLPDKDGITILQELKNDSKTSNIPVIMLTAKSSEYDKVLGLDSGADDYISKPFGMMELLSRVKALLRRASNDTDNSIINHKNLKIDTKAHRVFVEGVSIELTLKEYELLLLLLQNKGIVLQRDVILQNIWGYDFDGETRTVDVHIRTLRSKLNITPDIIETVRGVGYRIT